MTEATAAPSATILIIDDNLTNLQILFRTLKEAGHRVVPAQGAASAFTRLHHRTPDLILLDIMMPEVDGFELYRQLRANPATATTPVIFISALNDDEAIVQAFQLGAVDYVTKPFRTEEVLARVSRQLELDRLRRTLEQELQDRRQLEVTLREAKERADAANKAKSAFLANMSHELRTPLNSILGFAQVMERDASLSEGQRGRAASMRRGGEYLLALINDVLDLAKIEAGRFECLPRDWETASFFRQIQEMIRPRAEARGLFCQLRLAETMPPALCCDHVRLRQVLMNLLGNAIKFTERGGVTLSGDYRHGCLRLEVLDSGVGMTPAELARIFDPFVQVGSEDKRTQGTGLGLAISRRLVEAMDGVLTVESEPGGGSCFHCVIPAEPARLSDVTETPAGQHIIGYRRRAGKGPLRLLTVDDVADNRHTLRELLEPLGFVIEEAGSGRECLDQVAAAPPDAVLLDLRMPRMDGGETARRLRAMPGQDKLPIIAVSASVFQEDATQAQAAGCNAHVAKPLILDELLTALGNHLPLEWVRQDTLSGEGTEAPARSLTEEERQSLLRALKSGAITEVQRIAAALATADYPPKKAKKMLAAAQRFDLKRVRALLSEME